MTASTISHVLLSSMIASIFVAQTSAYILTQKSLFDIGCATLCQNHVGDPIDVSGVDFADLVSLYLDGSNGSGNSTMGNSTMGGNSTDDDFEDSDVNIIYGDIQCWDVSDVTDMSGAFAFQDEFDTSLGCWNVISVTDMSNMFLDASSFNQDLNSWAEKVPRDDIDTTDMFKGTACDVQTDPDTIGRPWCQFNEPQFSPQFKCFFFGEC